MDTVNVYKTLLLMKRFTIPEQTNAILNVPPVILLMEYIKNAVMKPATLFATRTTTLMAPTANHVQREDTPPPTDGTTDKGSVPATRIKIHIAIYVQGRDKSWTPLRQYTSTHP
jgi:hypothetical protein